MPALLRSYAENGADAAPEVVSGTAVGRDGPVAFAYSGNGSQWVGMGRAAYRDSRLSGEVRRGGRLFQALSGWSLAATMESDELAGQLGKTSVAQPLIFAIQAATTFALASSASFRTSSSAIASARSRPPRPPAFSTWRPPSR